MGTSLADLYSANHSGIKSILVQYRSHGFRTTFALEVCTFIEVGALKGRRWEYGSILCSFHLRDQGASFVYLSFVEGSPGALWPA